MVRRGEPILYVYTPSPEPTAQLVDPLAPRLVDAVETVVKLKAGGPNYVKLSYDEKAR